MTITISNKAPFAGDIADLDPQGADFLIAEMGTEALDNFVIDEIVSPMPVVFENTGAFDGGDILFSLAPAKQCADCGEEYRGDEHFHAVEPYVGCNGAPTLWQVRGSESDFVAEVPDEAMCRRIVTALNR